MNIQQKARILQLEKTEHIKKRQQTLLWRAKGSAAHFKNLIQGRVHPSFRKDYS